MPENHVGPSSVNLGIKTVAFYSIKQPKNLIVFVHGFGGSAVTTWNDFPSILTGDDTFKNSDIIFYGYDSLHSQANNLGLRFYQFLKAQSIPQNNSFNKQREINEGFKYERIILVAHSLGSIVVRKALLNAKVENANWLDICKMVFFAPAHKGARIQRLVWQCLPGIAKVLAGLGEGLYPITEDLRPDSRSLTQLVTETEKLLLVGEGEFTKAQSVVWAGLDRVVYNERFCHDPIAQEVAGKKHTSICKPIANVYIEPLTHLINALNQLHGKGTEFGVIEKRVS